MHLLCHRTFNCCALRPPPTTNGPTFLGTNLWHSLRLWTLHLCSPNRTLEQTNTQNSKCILSSSAWTGCLTALKQEVHKISSPLILTPHNILTPLLFIINEHGPALEHAHTIREIWIFYSSGLLKEEQPHLTAKPKSNTIDVSIRSQSYAFNIATKYRVLRFCLYASAHTLQRFYDTKVYQTYHISQDDDENDDYRRKQRRQCCMPETSCLHESLHMSDSAFHCKSLRRGIIESVNCYTRG